LFQKLYHYSEKKGGREKKKGEKKMGLDHNNKSYLIFLAIEKTYLVRKGGGRKKRKRGRSLNLGRKKTPVQREREKKERKEEKGECGTHPL